MQSTVRARKIDQLVRPCRRNAVTKERHASKYDENQADPKGREPWAREARGMRDSVRPFVYGTWRCPGYRGGEGIVVHSRPLPHVEKRPELWEVRRERRRISR